jgi:hypothetical protein
METKEDIIKQCEIEGLIPLNWEDTEVYLKKSTSISARFRYLFGKKKYAVISSRIPFIGADANLKEYYISERF